MSADESKPVVTETSPTPEPEAAAAVVEHETPKPSAPSVPAGATFFEPLQQNPLYNSIKEVLMWRNLVKSAVAFVVINTIFLLVLKGGYSFLTLTCYALLVVETACFAYAYGTIAYGKFVLKKDLENPLAGKVVVTLPRESFTNAATMLADFTNAAMTVITNAFCFKNIGVSVGCAFGLLFCSWLGKKVRLTTLVYTAALVLFVWPRLYHEQHALIDKYVGMAHQAVVFQVQRLWNMIKEKLPAKVGPIKLKDA